MKIVAKALLRDPENNLLLLYRGLTHPNFPGNLDLPGGEVEEDESHVKAVEREIKEETALTVDSKDIEEVFSKQHSDVLHLLFETKIDEIDPEITLSWEHHGYKWFSLNDLLAEDVPSNADTYYLDVLEYLISSCS